MSQTWNLPDQDTDMTTIDAVIKDLVETLATAWSGTSFPVTNLYVGMTCFRTDENKLYRLTALTPTWSLEKDFNLGASGVLIQDTAPAVANYAPGTFWINSTNGKTYWLYEDADGKQWVLQSDPSATNLGEGAAEPGYATLTDGANISWDADANKVAEVTLGGNRTLDNPTSHTAGNSYILVVKQDATGGRTLSYGAAYKWPGGTAPTRSTGANAIDILTFISDGTNLYGIEQKDFQ